MKRFDDRGGRRTAAREIALWQWEDRREAAKHHRVELFIKLEDMGDMAERVPSGRLWLLKEEVDEFYRKQSKGESNGQTLARLLRTGTWNVVPLGSSKP